VIKNDEYICLQTVVCDLGELGSVPDLLHVKDINVKVEEKKDNTSSSFSSSKIKIGGERQSLFLHQQQASTYPPPGGVHLKGPGGV